MNSLLILGLLLITGYTIGIFFDKIGIPKIIGYIATGIIFSPNTLDFMDADVLDSTQPLMDACLAIITFEVGGALKWSKIKKHEKEIISITLLASLFPFLLISIGIISFGLIFPALMPFDFTTLMAFVLLLGALASPTEPAATLAIMHQYKAKGKVSDTIMGVAALDDVVGILLFSLTLGVVSILIGDGAVVFENAIFNSLYEIIIAVLIGVCSAILLNTIVKFFLKPSEGQWIVMLFAIIILCMGISKYLKVDQLLSCMTMGVVVVNKSPYQKFIFRILERYTEELIFLFFFLLSGLHLDISTLSQAAFSIALFVLLRIIGKYSGSNIGARIVGADPMIQKHTGGGLLPQGGIVIGLVLSIHQKEEFKEIAEILLTTIMGATVINELIGPFSARHSLKKSGEIIIQKTKE